MAPDLAAAVAWLATGFGAGQLPLMPGTAGAALGVVLALGLARLPLHWRIAAAAALVVLAIPVCQVGAQAHDGADAPRIVADEALTFPVATAVLPVHRQPLLLGGVFLLSRVLDHLKPPPARQLERLHGGLGIVLDDLASNLWTLLGACAWLRWRRRKPG